MPNWDASQNSCKTQAPAVLWDFSSRKSFSLNTTPAAHQMGRRAKNKQGDPAPLADANGFAGKPSAKKLGKRKAEAEDDVSKRPAKKVKEVEGKKADKKVLGKKVEAKKPKGPAAKSAPAKKARESSEDLEEGGSSEGWEDVEDAGDVKAQAKCVCFLALRLVNSANVFRSLFHESDDEDLAAFNGDLEDFDTSGLDEE